MKNMMIDMGLARYATAEEVSVFNKVNALLNEVSDDFYDDIVTAISNHVFMFRENTRKYYQRIYRYAKKLGVKPSELILWYYIESEN